MSARLQKQLRFRKTDNLRFSFTLTAVCRIATVQSVFPKFFYAVGMLPGKLPLQTCPVECGIASSQVANGAKM